MMRSSGGKINSFKVGLIANVSIAVIWTLFFVNWSDWFIQARSTLMKSVAALPSTNTTSFSLDDNIQYIRKNASKRKPVIIRNNSSEPSLLQCPETSPHLIGHLNVTFTQPPTFEKIAEANPLLKSGGWYRPPNCKPRNGPTAIIVPYRSRELHLRAFLHHLHPILQRQQLEYVIIVVEQAGNNKFNRALLLNIGFNESLRLLFDKDTQQFQCYIFHDVDLLPEDDRGIYTCKDNSIHLSGYVDKFGYQLPYPSIFGGASAIPRQHFELINGYSNVFFGWGGEDDDMHNRLFHSKIPITRYKKEILQYKMIRHGHESTNPGNPHSIELINKGVARMHSDGLNSLSYSVVKQSFLPTHTELLVEFTEEQVYQAAFGKPTIQL